MAKAAAQKQGAASGVLCLKITLRHVKPPIWRRVLMPGGMTLADLHLAIQAVMGWGDSHLHAFDINGEQYGDPTTTDDVASERRLTLSTLARNGVTRFTYTYDFGDDWEHDILIEKAPPAHSAKAFPACIGGKRNCPPEDCGGAWGYAELLPILADPANPRHDEMREWLGEDFDPEAFSVEDADTSLAAFFARKEPAADAELDLPAPAPRRKRRAVPPA
nr:plasmid pRiA4b ORF-3 family protein [uncultured Rhodopila sp.]